MGHQYMYILQVKCFSRCILKGKMLNYFMETHPNQESN